MKRRILLTTLIIISIISSSFLFALPVLAATTEYFVLATGSNDWDSTSTWSYNSNGSPTGAPVPDSTVNVLPSTSIATGATLADNGFDYCLSINWTGCINTPAFTGTGFFYTYGNVTYISAMTISQTYWYPSADGTLTTNGKTITCSYIFLNGGTVTQGDDCTTSANINAQAASGWNTNGHTLTTTGATGIDLTQSGGAAVVFNYSNSTVSTKAWNFTNTSSSGITLTSNSSSKLVITASAQVFQGEGLTYNGEIDFNGTGTTTINGANTFNNLVLPSGTTQTIKFPHAVNTTVVSCSLSGSAGHVHTLTTDSGTSTWNLVKSGGGTVTVSYCTISYSVASPSSTWYYDNHCTYNSTSGWSSLTAINSVLGVAYSNISSIMGVAISNINTVLGIH